MHDEDDDEAAGGDFAGADDRAPVLQAVLRFARLAPRVAWFSSLGEALSPAEASDARAYVEALGFPEAHVTPVADWEEAEAAIRNPGWNSAWWEAEELSRTALIAMALEHMAEADLLAALSQVTASAAQSVHGAAAIAAARSGLSDEGLIRAAAGAATQACYQAALVLASVPSSDAEHPFALKFRLYEAGRWPLGIVGTSFNLF